MEEFTSRALEMRCSRRDIEVWRHAAGVVSLPQELWSSSVLFVVVGISSFRSSRLAVCVSPLVKLGAPR